MKKIGILYGKETTFPNALIEKINSKNETDIIAEPVIIHKALQEEFSGYTIIIDRISQDVPFYRAYLKNAALGGTAVINNPFWWSADEKFFNNALATKLEIPVPKTALLPSWELPSDTSGESFRNLAYPLDWDSIFDYVGFPAYMKPFAGGGWKSVYKLHNKEEFYHQHSNTGQLVMMLQEEIIFEEYYRCYCIGAKHVRVMPYEPRNPFHERYMAPFIPSEKLMKTMEAYTIKLNEYLGYDFNTVEFAVRNGIPYAIDFCNPAPDADLNSIGQENFDWIVETSAQYAIERTKSCQDNMDNLTWGKYIQHSVEKKTLSFGKKEKTVKAGAKKPTKKAAAKKSSGSKEKKKQPSGPDANSNV